MALVRYSALCAALFAFVVTTEAVGQETTPAMVAAAEKEGKVVWYTAVDVKVAEAVAKVFRAEYPKIAHRGRALRIRARVPADQPGVRRTSRTSTSSIRPTRRTSSFWKQQKLARAAHTPPDVQRFPAQYKDPEGYYAVWRATLA